MSEVVARIAEHAPEAAAMLQRMIEQLQLGRVRNLLAELGPGDDEPQRRASPATWLHPRSELTATDRRP